MEEGTVLEEESVWDCSIEPDAKLETVGLFFVFSPAPALRVKILSQLPHIALCSLESYSLSNTYLQRGLQVKLPGWFCQSFLTTLCARASSHALNYRLDSN